jgi:hypothetical protein
MLTKTLNQRPFLFPQKKNAGSKMTLTPAAKC